MKKNRSILLALAGVFFTGYGLSAQLLSANVRQATNTGFHQTSQVLLRDALQKFKNHFGVDILFEEKVLEGITISPKQLQFGADAERDLLELLQHSGLRLKKVDKKTFVILSNKTKNINSGNLERIPKSSGQVPAGGSAALITGMRESIVSVREVIPDRIVTGQVLSETGEELPGVSVLLKGTQSGTATDDRGNFSISIPDDNAVLIFSFIGYIREEITVGARNRLDVELKADNQIGRAHV